MNAGGSVDLRIESGPDVPYRIEIYRTGHYGGDQGRLISVLPGRAGLYQQPCHREPSTTGIVDCSMWGVDATVTTTTDWVSGVYLLKLIREDNGQTNEILLVVRDDSSHSDVAFMVPTSTYQAYNNYYAKSLYSGASDLPNTVSGAPRAVTVSSDRPYAQPSTPSSYRRDWYTRTDVATVSWLEQQGYDVSYFASEDLHANGARAQNHEVLISGAHDEYWSQEMFDAAIAARDAGTSLFFTGANSVYWRIRFVAGSQNGVANRMVVGYKTIESGPADPSGSPTTTWRDPAGPNRPENELQGQMYVGENISHFFPMRVSAAEGKHRLWRYTSVAELPGGGTAAIGTGLIGWEWNSRIENGREPAGVQTIASSPVFGNLIQGNGAFQSEGNATATTTVYKVASGATVFASGTNNWWRGLARNVDGEGEPDSRIQQATINAMSDMGAQPATPATGLVKDAIGAPRRADDQPGRRRRRRPAEPARDRDLRPADRSVLARRSQLHAARRRRPAGRRLGRVRPRLAHRDADAGRDARAVRHLHGPDRGRRQELARRGDDLAAHVDVHHRSGHPARRQDPHARLGRDRRRHRHPRDRALRPPAQPGVGELEHGAPARGGRRARPRPGHLRRRRPHRAARPRRFARRGLDVHGRAHDRVARQRRHADGLGGVVELHDRPEPAGHVAHSAPAGERYVAGRRGARRVLPRRRHRHAERLELPAHRPRRTAGAGAGDLRRDDAHGDAAPGRAADAAQHLHGERHGRRARGRRRRHRAVRLDVHDGRHPAARAGRDRGDAGRRQPGRHARGAHPRDVRPAAGPRDGDDAELHAHARRRIAGGRDRHL